MAKSLGVRALDYLQIKATANEWCWKNAIPVSCFQMLAVELYTELQRILIKFLIFSDRIIVYFLKKIQFIFSVNLNCIYNEDYINIHLVSINFQVFLYKVTEKLYYPAKSNESLMKSLSLIQWTKPVIYSVWRQKKSSKKISWSLEVLH